MGQLSVSLASPEEHGGDWDNSNDEHDESPHTPLVVNSAPGASHDAPRHVTRADSASTLAPPVEALEDDDESKMDEVPSDVDDNEHDHHPRSSVDLPPLFTDEEALELDAPTAEAVDASSMARSDMHLLDSSSSSESDEVQVHSPRSPPPRRLASPPSPPSPVLDGDGERSRSESTSSVTTTMGKGQARRLFKEVVHKLQRNTAPWEEREACLSQLEEMVRAGYVVEEASFWKEEGGKLRTGLLEQLQDSRPVVFNRIAALLSALTERVGKSLAFGRFLKALFPDLLDRLSSSNVVVARACRDLLLFMMPLIRFTMVIPPVARTATTDGNAFTREACTRCVAVMMEFCTEREVAVIRKKHLATLEDLIIKNTQDSNSDVRLAARRAFLEMEKHFLSDTVKLFPRLDARARKTIAASRESGILERTSVFAL